MGEEGKDKEKRDGFCGHPSELQDKFVHTSQTYGWLIEYLISCRDYSMMVRY